MEVMSEPTNPRSSLVVRSGLLVRRFSWAVALFTAGLLSGAALTASAKEVPYDLLNVFLACAAADRGAVRD